MFLDLLKGNETTLFPLDKDSIPKVESTTKPKLMARTSPLVYGSIVVGGLGHSDHDAIGGVGGR